MRTIAHYMDYAAQSFGVASRSNLETKHLALFKKYLHNVIQDWELKGDMDYLKQLGVYMTKAATTGVITASKGGATVTLSVPVDFSCLGCDLQANGRIYTIQQFVSTTSVKIFPAWMDDDTASTQFEIRYNRFVVPPYFKKILNQRMYYMISATDVHYIKERDFALIPKDNAQDYPYWYQIKHSARNAGFTATGTVSGTTITLTVGTFTDEMANKPVRVIGNEGVYYLRSITDATHAELDRTIETAITVAGSIEVIPEGTMFFEIFPHPNDSKEVIFDYVMTEEDKAGDTEILLAPAVVVEAGLDKHLGKFVEASASAQQLSVNAYEAVKEAAKTKCVTEYAPTLVYLSKSNLSGRNGPRDYGGGRSGYYPGRRYLDRR